MEKKLYRVRDYLNDDAQELIYLTEEQYEALDWYINDFKCSDGESIVAVEDVAISL